MVREIKFRFYVDGEMAYCDILNNERNDKNINAYVQNMGGDTIMQYTGLKDKNGKDVYEGDIVNCSNGCPHKVIWREATAFVNMGGWDLEGLIPGKYDWIGNMEEVIGNIYENPELLK